MGNPSHFRTGDWSAPPRAINELAKCRLAERHSTQQRVGQFVLGHVRDSSVLPSMLPLAPLPSAALSCPGHVSFPWSPDPPAVAGGPRRPQSRWRALHRQYRRAAPPGCRWAFPVLSPRPIVASSSGSGPPSPGCRRPVLCERPSLPPVTTTSTLDFQHSQNSPPIGNTPLAVTASKRINERD